MTAHVFIVDDNTFPVHLRYQFAGTTAGAQKQRNFSLFADIARVRPGDRAYFYLLRKGFYGPFKIEANDACDCVVWWDNGESTYLQEQLRRRLIYRVKVVHDNTYPIGVSEWDALDKYLRVPDKCLWSLVFRKLKGERGCTMIFPWEDKFLLELIRNRNEQKGRLVLQPSKGEHLDWNPKSQEIEIRPGAFADYNPSQPEHLSAPEDPADKLRLASGAEIHLQAFLMYYYGQFEGSELVFGPTSTICWVGNEVACGTGMQKIDIFVINQREDGQRFRILELKKDIPDKSTVDQFIRYIEWTQRFVPSASLDNIQPVLVCRNLKSLILPESVKESFHNFNLRYSTLPLKYIECRIEGGYSKHSRKLYFEEILY